MVKGKEKFALWITPECKQLVDDCYADDQCQSRSEYIEKAIWFYSGFLHAEKADRYLPKALQQILSGTLERFAERIGRQLFKLAVEQNVNNHTTTPQVGGRCCVPNRRILRKPCRFRRRSFGGTRRFMTKAIIRIFT